MAAGHSYQYAPGNSAITRSSGCTWTTGATGISVVTGGRYNPTPDAIHALVKRSEEWNPTTPGWSLQDLDKAMGRFGMSFEVHIGDGWAEVEKARADGRFLVIQGDSDQFGNGTCSGAFDGLHCIGVDGSKRKVEGGVEWWWIHDPICPTGRWERKYVIRNYAEKLLANVFLGWFVQKVPVSNPTWTWTLRPVAGHETRYFNEFLVDDKGRITGKKPHRTRGASVPCTAPKHYAAAPGKPASLAGDYVKVLGGDWKGMVLNAKYAEKG